MCVCGGGVLAGVEQSCNEQILEREIERERARPKKQERTDDLVESGYNNNPGLGERWIGEDKGKRRGVILFFFFCFFPFASSGKAREPRLQITAEQRGGRGKEYEEGYSLSVMSAEVCVRG